MAWLSVQLLPLEAGIRGGPWTRSRNTHPALNGPLVCSLDEKPALVFGYFTDDQSHRDFQYHLGADYRHDQPNGGTFRHTASPRIGRWGRSYPAPQTIAAVPFDEFAAKARMGYHSAYVHAIASRIADGSLDLEGWQDEELTATGPYGAACLMLYLSKPEHINADSWARMLLGKELGHPVTDKEVTAFFDGYGQWRGLVYNFYPWKSEG